MSSRSLLLAGLFACSRTSEVPIPKVVAETPVAPPSIATDAGAARPAPEPQSPFTIALRAPTALGTPYDAPSDDLGRAMPFVSRTAKGGLVVAAQYARGEANASGPFEVALLGAGLEIKVLYAPPINQGFDGFRWVWSDETLSVMTDENQTSRSGPRLETFKLGADGWKRLRDNMGYFSAVKRGDSVLALERTAYEIPNSSIYPKGSPYEQNAWAVKPARVAVLSGKAAPPLIPNGLCPTAMAAAPDGALVITVDKCVDGLPIENGVLRYAPGSTQAKVEWFAKRPEDGGIEPDVMALFVASANEIYVGERAQLRTWDGKAWTTSEPFPGERLGSISRAQNGDLWAVLRGKRLVKRAGTTWTTVALPKAPADRLDPQAYALPGWEQSDFVAVDTPPDGFEARSASAADLIPYRVDATAEEIVVVASVEHEAFVLTTKARTPTARLPSIPVQRAKLAQTVKRDVPTPKSTCDEKSFFVFPDATSIDTVRRALGTTGAVDGGAALAKAGEAIVEGQKRVVVYGEKDALKAAATPLAKLTPKRLCGPAVIDKEP